ncbi:MULTISPECIES: IS110 family transposase [Bacillus]|uniref:IS110 family transposase n=2 Tax=Bacillus cereus group TaxID=86661 RepID=A0A2A7DDX0_BACAN|nr:MULTISPECIES: IS110 family transposase [Bacillus]MCP1162383.1 IS110 family transposase [Bacillus sp. 1813sda1]MDC7973632.1 IS110 family transposase [Bacillus sp. BLCC-B18]OTW67643.1 IS110 family transposase [Bacillus thuringiensis serovar coreanensis]OTX44260.1 IS110 family transposase [Bacillus thuringiensis serovar sooncheon]OTX53423.1 IS110 family transposase [Bacillus thuringiensis serovar guiyangiensis]
MHNRQNYLYVGVDLHKEQHTAVIINCWQEKLGEIQFDNKPSAFSKFLLEVETYVSDGLSVVFGLEDVGGYGRALAKYLVDHEQVVKEVNPALSFLERKSQVMIQKNDSWDAECVARILGNKFNQLPDVKPNDLFWSIQQLVSRRNALVKAQSALKNQLHIQLNHHYPSYKKFFSELDGKTALAFWQQYPSPSCLEGTNIKRLTAFLLDVSNNTCSIKKASDILKLVKEDGHTMKEYQETRDFLVRSIVRDIEFKKTEMKYIERELKQLVNLLDYQLETMPGIELVTASALIAEIGDVRRFSNANKLARFAGIAPVYFGSGGKGKTHKSKQGNRALHALFYNLAVQQVQVAKGSKLPRNPVFHAYYQKKLKEGKTKGQALVCIMRRLVNIIYGMMKYKTAYELPIVEEKEVV